MRFAIVAFLIAASVGYAAGRWDGQFVANTAGARNLVATAGADSCTAIPKNGAYLHVSCDGDAFVGVGKLLNDGGVGIGTGVTTGGGCRDNDAGIVCDVVMFSTGIIFFIQAKADSNEVCERSMDAGTRTCQIGVAQ